MKKYKDRKGINLLTIFLVIDLLAVFASFKTSGAVYQAQAIGTTDAEVAFYAFNASNLESVENENDLQAPTKTARNIFLGDIGPGDTRTYKIVIYNTDDEKKDKDNNPKRSDTSIVYDLKIITTTNVNFEYELYYRQKETSSNAVNILDETLLNSANPPATNEVLMDDWGTYFRTISVKPKCLTYKADRNDFYYLKIKMPETFNTADYQDLLESITIEVTSRQALTSDMPTGLTCN